MLQSLTLRRLAPRVTTAVLVMLSLSLMVLHKIDQQPVEKLRVALTDMMAPALAFVSDPVAQFADSFDGIKTMRTMKAENIRLQAENARLHQWYEAALRYKAENQSLKELLNVKADPTLTFVTARVVSDPGGAFVKSLLLPVGVKDNVAKGNAVMSGQGLVGRVIEAGTRSSRVLLVTDLNSHIPVVIQNTRTKAILAGKNDDLMKLERLPIDSGLSVGQRVVTSGDGGQLPPDIPVGTIVQVGPDGAFVQPLSDLERLAYVQVINADIDHSLVTGDVTPPRPKRGR
ncbi:MAG: rod shape-determining protein MreC [Alphaproteobacteria bacterium]|nr:rod shape-determining protein MreC [Alphaproteobacteria bacterium]